MNSSIFGKPLEQVTYEDVVSFCDGQVEEGLILDYKLNLSNVTKIVKTLVSFANTNGGWVIIGVDDDNDKPKLPVIGMDFVEKGEQQINNAIISTVNPIILPQYRVVHSSDNKHTFIIAHMPMSPSAPHWMQYSRKNILFTRLADRANGQDWEDYASSHQWEMLQGKRKASRQLREEIASYMDSIFTHAAWFNNDNDASLVDEPFLGLYGAGSRTNHSQGTLSIRIMPEFPSVPIMSVLDAQDHIASDIISNDPSVYPHQTPINNGHDPQIYQQGAYTCYKDIQTKLHYFFGVDIFGSVMNVVPIEKTRTHNDNEYTLVEIKDMAATITGALSYAGKLYESVAYDANLRITLELNVRERTILFKSQMPGEGWHWDDRNQPCNLSGMFYIQRTALASSLSKSDDIIRLTSDMLREAFYAFGYPHFDKSGMDLLLKLLTNQPA